MPDLIIIAGPNGAGKTSFAREYLSQYGLRFEFINADEIARRLALEGRVLEKSDIQAGRVMLKRLDDLVSQKQDFAIETTLATLIYAPKIANWRKQGYHVALVYLRLGSAAEALERVRRRVAAGGHDIPADVITRRFGKSSSYFEQVYKPIVDQWYVYESREGDFSPSESSE
ncbi:putative ABC-type ATPase [Bradyrhizobium sp. LB7.2]|uniref:AAA family ATPase n=1 Tax=Bradyrhizobium sp. LB14.3 TaxID=3156328 RepID=UPI003392BBA6